jgi:hypothetical protein
VSELWNYLYVRQSAAIIDSDQSGDIGNRKAVDCDGLMSVQFPIHPFKTLINDRALRLSIFRELPKTALKERVGILSRACDWSEQF